MEAGKADIVPTFVWNKKKKKIVPYSFGKQIHSDEVFQFFLLCPPLSTPSFHIYPQGSKSYFHCDTGLITFGLLDDAFWRICDIVLGTSHTSVELISF